MSARPATDPDTLPEVLTLAEAAALLRLSETVVGERAAAGTIPGEYLGQWRFRKSRLLAMLDTPAQARRREPVAPPEPGARVRPVLGKGPRARGAREDLWPAAAVRPLPPRRRPKGATP